MCTSAGPPTGGQLGRFALGPTPLGAQKDRYTLIEQSNHLLEQSGIILWGGPTFISCPGPVKFSRRPCVPLNAYSKIINCLTCLLEYRIRQNFRGGKLSQFLRFFTQP